jgi:hypothetical protein
MNESTERMKTLGAMLALLCLGIGVCGTARAEDDLVITSFRDGSLSWTNVNPALYYTVEYRPSLAGTNDWTGDYRSVIDTQSSKDIITVPVGVFYRVVGSTNPAHTRTLSDATTAVEGGYYAATNLAAVDPHLAPGNIAMTAAVFGVSGTLNTLPAPAPATGQTTSYRAGDDGAYANGVPWPTPRFTVQADTNVVADNLTGLMWTRNTNPGGTMNWTNAINYCTGMNAGEGTFGYTDWRLPNLRELHSLMDYGRWNPALPTNHPFVNVQDNIYWTSTTYLGGTWEAWIVHIREGFFDDHDKLEAWCTWPVRGAP